jgi:energy-coupling factor transport system permease protein
MARAFAYRRGDSFLHRVDPLSKLLWLLSVMLIAFLVSGPIAELVLLAIVTVTAIWLAKMPPGEFWHSMRYLVFISVSFVVVETLFFAGTDVIARLGPFSPTWQGLELGIGFALRLMTIGGASLAFTYTTDPRVLTYALIRYGRVPYRYGFMVLAGLRFMPVLEDELTQIYNAHSVRGALSRQAGMLQSARHLKQFAVPLLIRGLSRAQKGALAMDARGFGVRPTRTYMDPPPSFWVPGVAYGLAYLSATIVIVALHLGVLGRL